MMKGIVTDEDLRPAMVAWVIFVVRFVKFVCVIVMSQLLCCKRVNRRFKRDLKREGLQCK